MNEGKFTVADVSTLWSTCLNLAWSFSCRRRVEGLDVGEKTSFGSGIKMDGHRAQLEWENARVYRNGDVRESFEVFN